MEEQTRNMNTDSNQISERAILDTLRTVIDPEIGCNVVDLGLIYSLSIEGSRVRVVMTLTTPGCPMHESIRWGVHNALLGLESVDEVDVELVWDPPWNPQMMSEAGREATGARF